MGMRRRRGEQQESLFITADRLPKSEGHGFYRKLKQLLDEAGFDRFVEDLCEPCYADPAKGGRPSAPPGVYSRMPIVGYFEPSLRR